MGTLLQACGCNAILLSSDAKCQPEHPHNIEAAVQDVKSVCWHPSGELLVSCSYDDSIKLWTDDGGEWICTQTLEGKMLCQMLDAKSVVQVVCDCSCLLFRLLNQVFSRWLSPNKQSPSSVVV